MDRRDFIVNAASVSALSAVASMAHTASAGMQGASSSTAKGADDGLGSNTITIGVIGCGGRGSGAAVNAIEASPDTRIIALADLFPDRLASARTGLAQQGDRLAVPESSCFWGFDAYQKVLATGCDVVILATPPAFRPGHLEAAIAAGKNVFMEKPVAVDPAGIRKVLAACRAAKERGLSVVAGTQRRHEACYQQAMDRIHAGVIGRPIAARCFWNMGGLWSVAPQSGRSDVENQLRNWLYYTWLSGDHIVEQHVHNIDVVNWAFLAHPIRCVAVGGRQSRTDPLYGNIFDHFGVDFEYPGNRFALSMARQWEGTPGRVSEFIYGSEGTASLNSGACSIDSKDPWSFSGKQVNPYVQEHMDLIAAIQSGHPVNEGEQVAFSTLSAIMARMAAYSGQVVTWEEALASPLDLMPSPLEFGPLPVSAVAIPGRG
ncbi:MAG: Gfo/Idh/MocA family oxidoreductase [Phycisphaerales bacterium]|nr:Gfo/Idh/MocA family oxidoreductase [Phycisphaerales bacterium]